MPDSTRFGAGISALATYAHKKGTALVAQGLCNNV